MKITKKKILWGGLIVLILFLSVITVQAFVASIIVNKIALKNLDTNTITKDFPPGTNIRYGTKFTVDGSPAVLYKVRVRGEAGSLFRPDGVNREWLDMFDNPGFQIKNLYGGQSAIVYWDRKIPEGATPGTEAGVKFRLELGIYDSYTQTWKLHGTYYGTQKFNIVLPLIEPQPEILYPTPEEIIGGTTVIVARDQSHQNDIKSVLFEYADCCDFCPWTKIGDETNNLNTEMIGSWQVAWDTSALESRDYCIKVSMTDYHSLFAQVTIPVKMNLPPIASATATLTATTIVKFDASGSSDPGASSVPPGPGIVRYEWDFEDDGTFDVSTTSAITTHQYQAAATTTVALKVTDTEKAIDYEYFLLDFTAPQPLQVVTDCGCQSIQIKTAGTSGEYPPNKLFLYNPPYSATTTSLGLINTVTSPLQPGGIYRVYYAFEVEAKLKPGSNSTRCTFGQEVKRTSDFAKYDLTTNKYIHVTDHKTVGTTTYPQAGANYGNDDYSMAQYGTNALIKIDGLTIKWFDAPGFHMILTPQIAFASTTTGVWWRANFRAQVSGARGTCQAMWDYNFRIANNGATAPAPFSPPTISNINTTTTPAKLW